MHHVIFLLLFYIFIKNRLRCNVFLTRILTYAEHLGANLKYFSFFGNGIIFRMKISTLLLFLFSTIFIAIKYSQILFAFLIASIRLVGHLICYLHTSPSFVIITVTLLILICSISVLVKF